MAAKDRFSRSAEIVDAIYAGIRFPQAWPEIVRKVGDWLDADLGMMLSPSLPGVTPVPLVAYGVDLSPVLAKFGTHAGRAEFTHRALATGRAPDAFLLDELMSPEEQATNDFWQDIVAPLGVVSGIFSMVRTPDDNQRPVLINFYRRAGKPGYDTDDLEDMRLLVPHLRRALGVILDAPPPAEAPAEVKGVYDAIGAASFFYGPDGAVIHCNEAADALLAAKDGVSLRGHRVVLWDSTAQTEFDAALVRVIGEAWSLKYRIGAEVLARRPSGAAPFVVVVTPVGAENPISAWAAPVRCVAFFIEEKLRTNGLLSERLQRLYGLSKAEADVAIGIASGHVLRDLATSRGTKLETVRTQVKIALSKTGARKQSDLAALVNRLRF